MARSSCVLAVLVSMWGCGGPTPSTDAGVDAGVDPAAFWFPTSAELKLTTVNVFIWPQPSESSGCLRFLRSAMTAEQLEVLAKARLTMQQDRCTSDGCTNVRAEVVDENGTSFSAPVHGAACDCSAPRLGMPESIASLLSADQGSRCP